MPRSAMARRASAVGASKSFEDIPEIPGKLPILGTIYSEDADYLKDNVVMEEGTRLDKMWSHMQDKYVDPEDANMLRLTMGLVVSKHKSAVQIFDPEDVKTVAENEGDMPYRGEGFLSLKMMHQRANPNWNDGSLVTEDGEAWLTARSEVENELPQSALPYLGQINEVAAEFVACLRRDRDPTTLVNRGSIIHKLKLFGLEAIIRITLGTRLAALDDDPDPSIDEAIRSLSSYADNMDKLAMYPLWRIFSCCPRLDPNFRKAEDGSKVGWAFAKKLVDEAKEKFTERWAHESHEAAVPLMEKLMRKLGADSNLPFVTALDFISGGAENVATAASWLLYHLAKNPDKQEKLREEAMALGEEVTENDVSNGLHYAKAFVNESFRVSPTIAGTGRVIPHDIAIRGYHIPAGTYAFWTPHILGRDPKSFPDPDVFRPERWIEDKDRIHPYAVQPYAHGRRNCVAEKFAEMELLVLLAEVARNFKLEWAATEYETVEPVYKMFNRPNKELIIKFIYGGQ